jgi:serine/threonine-protein kinase
MEHRTKVRTTLSWIAAVVILVVVAVGVVWKIRTPEPHQVMRFSYELPEDQQLGAPSYPALAISPDGKLLVYRTFKGLYLRSVDELSAKLITGTEENPVTPFFSPDGKWIGYRSQTDNKLKKIAIGGGSPVALCDAATLLGASWGPDNTIVYGSQGSGIMRVSANGGTPECIVKAKSGVLAMPQILPDGKSMLYTVSTGANQNSIVVQSLKSKEPKELFAGAGARYLPTGHIVYGVGNNLLAVPFDADKLDVAGGPASIVEGVFRITAPQYAFSDSGTLAYIPGTAAEATVGRTLAWVDRNGKEEPLSASPNNYMYPKISPDGTRVAVTIGGANMDIWIWDVTRKTLTRLTFDEKPEIQSIWTPDGKRIVFASGVTGTNDVCWKAADGTGEVEKLGSVQGRTLLPWSFSSDGKNLLMVEWMGANFDIGMMSMEDNHARKPLLQQEKYAEIQPEISPDGRWMAYASTESGQQEVYVRPFPDVNKGRWQVSTGSGSCPLWSPNGRELFYLTNENSVMVTAVATRPTFSPGTPKALFRSIYVGPSTTAGTPWDISPDGKRFLMIKEPGSAASAGGGLRRINIVLNWLDELKQRVPVK